MTVCRRNAEKHFAELFCHMVIAMNIAQMIRRIIGCQTHRLAVKAIEGFDRFR